METFVTSYCLKQPCSLNVQQKMISCELFGHVYFATPRISRSYAYLDSFGKA